MLATYKATLQGDRLQWQEDGANPPSPAQPVEVLVTVLEQQSLADARERGKRMAQALRKLSIRNALVEITDPAQWERGTRQDRPLPGRET